MKYFVIKTTKEGIEYKRYKCIDGWTKNKEICWKFSRQGAKEMLFYTHSSLQVNTKAE